MKSSGNIISWTVKELLLFSFMVLALIVLSLSIALINGENVASPSGQVVIIALQNVLMFIMPVLVLARLVGKLEHRRVRSLLWLDSPVKWRAVALVLLVYVVALPAMNYIVDWNQNLHLPSSLSGVEKLLRQMEEAAGDITSAMLSTGSPLMLVILLLTVGLLTAIGEESFFRAGVLGIMSDGKVNRHVAVWVSAIVFSAIHFQFFGFVPRMLMGAWFGYLLLWSRSLWIPIIAHTLNNSMVVLFTYLDNNGIITHNYLDNLGVAQPGAIPWAAIVSVMLTVVVIFIFMRNNKKNVLTT